MIKVIKAGTRTGHDSRYGSAFADFAHPKGAPRSVSKAARTRLRQLLDDRESAKVRQRSGGRCELRPCLATATEVHHLIGGTGRRGRGDSALASHKLHLCAACHRAVTEHRIRLSWTDDRNPFGTLHAD